MEYTVISNRKIDWNAKGVSRILQNIANLLNTMKYEVAYDRLLGSNPDFLDKPYHIARMLMIKDVFEVIQNSEPRAKVLSVDVYEEGSELVRKVVVEIE